MTSPALTLPSSSGAKASNLAFALGCLPDQRRKDALVFYGFCRAVDDIADDPALPEEEKKAALDAWKAALNGEAPLPPELDGVIKRNEIDPALMIEIVRGVEADIHHRQPATVADLQAYCWQVASAVGLVSISIFGCRQPSSRDYAEQLGYALQVTNILRDVGEDALLGRIYLPVEDLVAFGVTGESLLAGKPDGDFLGLMRFEARRARHFYAEAQRHLASTDAKALTPAEMMREIYEKLLTKMEKDGFQVFARRYTVSKLRKMLIFARRQLIAIARRADA